jgi:hypothetical protein
MPRGVYKRAKNHKKSNATRNNARNQSSVVEATPNVDELSLFCNVLRKRYDDIKHNSEKLELLSTLYGELENLEVF